MKIELAIPFEGVDGGKYVAELICTSRGTKGRYSGPPEKCYPAEGPELSIVKIDAENGRTIPTSDWHTILGNSIEDLIFEKATKELEEGGSDE